MTEQASAHSVKWQNIERKFWSRIGIIRRGRGGHKTMRVGIDCDDQPGAPSHALDREPLLGLDVAAASASRDCAQVEFRNLLREPSFPLFGRGRSV
jgi:hypothetical protein